MAMVVGAGLLGSVSAAEPAYTPPKSEWKHLFNGKDLSNWDKFLATPSGSAPLVANVDPKGVFTVTNLNGENVIHVSGQNYGAITTHDEFTASARRIRSRAG